MINDELHSLLLTSFEARVLAETDKERDAQWETMKQKWSSRKKRQHPQQLSLSCIFNSIEAVLKRRQLLQTSDELLEKQIYKVLGPQPTNPNQLPWLRKGAPTVNLKHCTPLDFICTHSGAPRKKLLHEMACRPGWIGHTLWQRPCPGLQSSDVHAAAVKQVEDQQEPACVGMASLSLGPALKAQFIASSERSTPLEDGCATLCVTPPMDEDEKNRCCDDDLPTRLTLRITRLSQMTTS
eukprot:1580127-Rhodomonas_salina.1